jgi:hypothetical protein
MSVRLLLSTVLPTWDLEPVTSFKKRLGQAEKRPTTCINHYRYTIKHGSRVGLSFLEIGTGREQEVVAAASSLDNHRHITTIVPLRL